MHTRKSNLNKSTNIKKQFSKKIHDLQVAVTYPLLYSPLLSLIWPTKMCTYIVIFYRGIPIYVYYMSLNFRLTLILIHFIKIIRSQYTQICQTAYFSKVNTIPSIIFTIKKKNPNFLKLYRDHQTYIYHMT